MISQPRIAHEISEELVQTCHFIGGRDWCPATGGNFSARLDQDYYLITQSGKDKSRLRRDDLMVVTLEGQPIDEVGKPSAEVPLHTRLYQLDESIDCVLHTHSVHSTVLSRYVSGKYLKLQGYEMQKALRGNKTHTDEIQIRIFENDQNMFRLADVLSGAWRRGEITQPGVLVRGHGLYAWGCSIVEAQRHIEGFEFLFACLWQELLMGGVDDG